MRRAALNPKANPPHKKAAQSKAVSGTNKKLHACPTCGKMMNVGNLTQHIRRAKCGQQ
jgi:ribosomal protein S27AE